MSIGLDREQDALVMLQIHARAVLENCSDPKPTEVYRLGMWRALDRFCWDLRRLLDNPDEELPKDLAEFLGLLADRQKIEAHNAAMKGECKSKQCPSHSLYCAQGGLCPACPRRHMIDMEE